MTVFSPSAARCAGAGHPRGALSGPVTGATQPCPCPVRPGSHPASIRKRAELLLMIVQQNLREGRPRVKGGAGASHSPSAGSSDRRRTRSLSHDDGQQSTVCCPDSPCGPAGPARTPQHVEGTLACPSRLITLEMARGCQDYAHLIYAHICLGRMWATHCSQNAGNSYIVHCSTHRSCLT